MRISSIRYSALGVGRWAFSACLLLSAFLLPPSSLSQTTGARSAIRNGVLQNNIDFAGFKATNVASTVLADWGITDAASDAELNAGLALKVTANGAIVSATKTKITYDTKGLVTSGTDATTADIADGADKRYVTDAQRTAIDNAVPNIRTVNGFPLSANVTLTTANVADSTDKRYVTDAQRTAIDNAVPNIRTVNGFPLSANVTLTTANVADSTDKRYVTDAQRTVLQNTSGTNTGDQVVPANTTSTASQWFNAYNAATGAFTKAQPAFSDLSGSIADGQIPATFTRDTEWDTLLEIETVTGANIIQSTEIDTVAEINTLTTDADVATLTGTETFSGKTFTAPKFADLGFIADANGNEILIFDTVTSAVNEVKIENSITGSRPVITASGADANIGLSINPKGTGNVVVNSTTIPASNTLVVTTDKLSVHAATTSSELAGVISDETGTGAMVLAASPALTGTPTAPTAAVNTDTTQLATTAFVMDQAGYKHTQTLGSAAASIPFTVPSGYTNLRIIVQGRSDLAAIGSPLKLQFNADTAANYQLKYLTSSNSDAPTAAHNASVAYIEVGVLPGASTAANYAGAAVIAIPNYLGAFFKEVTARSSYYIGTQGVRLLGGTWKDTSPISSVTLFVTGANLVAGTTATLIAE